MGRENEAERLSSLKAEISLMSQEPVPRFDSLLDRCTFPPPGSPLVVAVSGGPDSTALLILAVFAGCKVKAVHVDHSVRPGSHLEATFVEDLCRRFGAEFESKTVTVKSGPNLEARMRSARNAVLPVGTATGHTADDQAESILINIMRGCGIDGMAAMEPKSQGSGQGSGQGPEQGLEQTAAELMLAECPKGSQILPEVISPRTHPIIRLRRAETRKLCTDFAIEVLEDPSNTDTRFLRNRVRNELIPLMEEISKRDIVAVITRQASTISEEVEFLNQLATRLDPTDARKISQAPRVLARRALRKWIADSDPSGYAPESAGVDRVLQVAAFKAKGCNVKNGLRVRRSEGRLRIEWE